MTKTERKVMEAFWNSHQQDRAYWHRDGVAAAIREVVNQLENTYEIKTGIHRTGMIFCADVLDLCEKLEKL